MEKLHLHLEQIIVDENRAKEDAVIEPSKSSIDSPSESEIPTLGAADSSPPPSDEIGLKIYTTGTLSQSPKSDFYSYGASDTLKVQLLYLTNFEGPIAEMELTGNKIVERLVSLMPRTVETTKEDGTTYYWPEGIDPKSWTGFRVAGPYTSSQRNVADICRQELANLIIHVLNNSGSTSDLELARTVCRLVGMARTTKDAEERVIKVVKRMTKDMRVIVENERFRLT